MGTLHYILHKKLENILAAGGDAQVLVDTHREDVVYPNRNEARFRMFHVGPNLSPPAPPEMDDEGMSVRILSQGAFIECAWPWSAVLGVVGTFPPGGGGTRTRRAA